jgi:hypothetical protein
MVVEFTVDTRIQVLDEVAFSVLWLHAHMAHAAHGITNHRSCLLTCKGQQLQEQP